jgi:hypothetical protein
MVLNDCIPMMVEKNATTKSVSLVMKTNFSSLSSLSDMAPLTGRQWLEQVGFPNG